MKILAGIKDIERNKELIENILENQGSYSEHYYYCYLYNIEKNEIPHVFVWGEDKAILSTLDNRCNEWIIFSGILSHEKEYISLLRQFLDYVFSKGAKKVWCEFKTDLRKKVLKSFKDSDYKINKIKYTLTWPVFDMRIWNGDKMEGKKWKNTRYYWNKFFKEHKVEFREYHPEDKNILIELVKKWKKERNRKDKTYVDYYFNIINNDFHGYNTRIMIVDDKICGITAGYPLKNNTYYSSIGIVSKEFDRAGDIANMDDLITLKKKGYELIDFGGGEKNLIEFKSKFKPTSYYKTHLFSIIKKNSR
ncbi:MAG: hypothetical protein KatS3mg002_1199 [Candidatus Woesearchaeota archaeon]|nr:MAG: hypothetical protein KatS3mg002_1199 [Candidatus Woesearchaeota archaeon]